MERLDAWRGDQMRHGRSRGMWGAKWVGRGERRMEAMGVLVGVGRGVWEKKSILWRSFCDYRTEVFVSNRINEAENK